MLFEDKHILITGGTGSLGSALLRRLLTGEQGMPERILILSRDEAKQSALREKYAFDELGPAFKKIVRFRVGDVRDYGTVVESLQDIHVVFNAAALKQVPTCEYFSYEAVLTNIGGPENIVRAIQQFKPRVETVVGISTDKACKPVNVMGMTKAIQERLFLSGNERCPYVRFVCVRYGNVLASRGSVVPLFRDQIKAGGPVTLTTPDMTRFLLSLDAAVDTIFAAVKVGKSGDTFVPRIPSARMVDLASVMIGDRPVETRIVGIRPGEKVHEILVSEEEVYRTSALGDYYYVISSVLSEFKGIPALTQEFSSADTIMNSQDLTTLLQMNGLLDD